MKHAEPAPTLFDLLEPPKPKPKPAAIDLETVEIGPLPGLGDTVRFIKTSAGIDLAWRDLRGSHATIAAAIAKARIETQPWTDQQAMQIAYALLAGGWAGASGVQGEPPAQTSALASAMWAIGYAAARTDHPEITLVFRGHVLRWRLEPAEAPLSRLAVELDGFPADESPAGLARELGTL